jgi:ferredoxin--NADP+ reductase
VTGTALLRVAVVGAGPAAFYAADALLTQDVAPAQVDMFERLPCPYGLVRFGVAPDHQKIKTVTRAFAKTAEHPNFRFFGNVEIGSTLTIADLREHYHQVLFATGAQSDRKMNIPGEDLLRSRPATDFVAWYNGHPYYRDLSFDLSQETVAIVGVGNVAVDVARILALSPAELARTDMAAHAIEALSHSRVRDIYLLGRRGPAQAAFTNPEVKELGELEAADVIVDPAEAELDSLSAQALEASGDRSTARKVELLHSYARRQPEGKRRRLHLRFLVSPLELLDDGNGAVGGMTLGRNRLVRTPSGNISAEPTGETESIPAGLVFRSVGYRGSPIPGVPFDERWGVIRNHAGRVVDEAGEHIAGLYTAGWIKRGPSGVIGTNKPDAVETVEAMIEDGRCRELRPLPRAGAVTELLGTRACRPVSFEEWQQLDALEIAAGEACGRPRVKFTSVEEMLSALTG